MDIQQSLRIFARTFGYILQENEGIVTDDIDGTKYYVYRHENQIKISNANDTEMMKSQNFKVGNWIWFHKTKEECVDAIIDDFKIQKEIEDLTKGNLNENTKL